MFFRRHLKSSERVLENNRRFVERVFAGMFVLLTLFFLGVWGSRREEVTIAEIKIIGIAFVAESDVRVFVDDMLDGAYGWLFPRRNSLLYPKDAIMRGLFENFPHIASVVVRRGSLRELFLEVEERRPSYLWCGETLMPADGHAAECYFLDPQGVIFAKAPSFSGNVYFEMYGALSRTNVFKEKRHPSPIGFLFLSPAEFSRVVLFKDSLEEAGIPAEKLVVSSEGGSTSGRKGDAEFIFSNSTRLVFNFQENLDAVMRNLFVAIETEPLSKEAFTEAEKVFEYVDARFENRIFYK